ncbi:hypothetical protein [Streptomyces sp. NPDC004270]
MRQNTKKVTVITDGQGRTLWMGAIRPGQAIAGLVSGRTAMR